MQRARLVTLTGPGGSGKTRLAEEAAAGLPQAWLVELAPLDRPEAVPGAVVSALGLRETVLMTHEMAMVGQDDPLGLLVEYCAPRSQLLILDNCEHVIGAAAELAETLLTRCPGSPSSPPAANPSASPARWCARSEPLPPDPARRLFMERAAAVRPDAGAALHDSEAVDEICLWLDGLPLAIELAAARLRRLLTPRQIADRLDDRFRLLTSGKPHGAAPPADPARGRRLVLGPARRTGAGRAVRGVRLRGRLGPHGRRSRLHRSPHRFPHRFRRWFPHGLVAGGVADLVGALVDKSLIVATPSTPYDEDGGGGRRYRMLETIHEYATERAAEVPELRAAAERRHRAWARDLVEEAVAHRRAPPRSCPGSTVWRPSSTTSGRPCTARSPPVRRRTPVRSSSPWAGSGGPAQLPPRGRGMDGSPAAAGRGARREARRVRGEPDARRGRRRRW